MVEIRLTELAWQDLDFITDYIASDSLRYASEFTDKVLNRIEVLRHFKESGRMVPEFQNESLRELVLGNYRIVYRIYSEHLVIVLRIIHGAKLLEI
jgi:plasmid stabilization system protein ParE